MVSKNLQKITAAMLNQLPIIGDISDRWYKIFLLLSIIILFSNCLKLAALLIIFIRNKYFNFSTANRTRPNISLSGKEDYRDKTFNQLCVLRNGRFLTYNLALSDFLVGVVSIWIVLKEEWFENMLTLMFCQRDKLLFQFYENNTPCKIRIGILTYPLVNSFISCICLTIDRFLAVAYSLKYKHISNKISIKVVLFSIWFSSGLITLLLSTHFIELPGFISEISDQSQCQFSKLTAEYQRLDMTTFDRKQGKKINISPFKNTTFADLLNNRFHDSKSWYKSDDYDFLDVDGFGLKTNGILNEKQTPIDENQIIYCSVGCTFYMTPQFIVTVIFGFIFPLLIFLLTVYWKILKIIKNYKLQEEQERMKKRKRELQRNGNTRTTSVLAGFPTQSDSVFEKLRDSLEKFRERVSSMRNSRSGFEPRIVISAKHNESVIEDQRDTSITAVTLTGRESEKQITTNNSSVFPSIKPLEQEITISEPKKQRSSTSTNTNRHSRLSTSNSNLILINQTHINCLGAGTSTLSPFSSFRKSLREQYITESEMSNQSRDRKLSADISADISTWRSNNLQYRNTVSITGQVKPETNFNINDSVFQTTKFENATQGHPFSFKYAKIENYQRGPFRCHQTFPCDFFTSKFKRRISGEILGYTRKLKAITEKVEMEHHNLANHNMAPIVEVSTESQKSESEEKQDISLEEASVNRQQGSSQNSRIGLGKRSIDNEPEDFPSIHSNLNNRDSSFSSLIRQSLMTNPDCSSPSRFSELENDNNVDLEYTSPLHSSNYLSANTLRTPSEIVSINNLVDPLTKNRRPGAGRFNRRFSKSTGRLPSQFDYAFLKNAFQQAMAENENGENNNSIHLQHLVSVECDNHEQTVDQTDNRITSKSDKNIGSHSLTRKSSKLITSNNTQHSGITQKSSSNRGVDLTKNRPCSIQYRDNLQAVSGRSYRLRNNYSNSSKTSRNNLKRSSSATKKIKIKDLATLGILIISILITWVPLTIAMIYKLINYMLDLEANKTKIFENTCANGSSEFVIAKIFLLILISNSLKHPLIYFLTNRDFREQFLEKRRKRGKENRSIIREIYNNNNNNSSTTGC